jgi:hypothetical protein
MSRFTFHILLPIVAIAFVIPVVGGPWWGYPVTLALAFLATVFIAAYPTDTSLRWIFAGFGVFLLLPPLTHLWLDGACWYVIREAAFTLLLGLACIWSAAFPVSETGRTEKHSCKETTDLNDDSLEDQGSR